MKISIYAQGGVSSATTYYRYMQYVKRINADVLYNLYIPDDLYQKWMPIGDQGIHIKVFFWLFMFFRILYFLVRDALNTPDIIVISRILQKKYMPLVFKCIIKIMKYRKCRIIWDFDDNIIQMNEISARDFNYFSRVSNVIIISSAELKKLILKQYLSKVILLPTTDGDMYNLFSNQLTDQRAKTLEEEVRLVWVATSSSLPYLKMCVRKLKKAGSVINKKVVLTVICDKPLDSIVCGEFFIINNIKWTRDVAISEMMKAHIGIMPVADNELTRGKGGFKLIQYISIGLPVVGSAVGINKEIVTKDSGKLVCELESDEWIYAIKDIVKDIDTWKEYSYNAYNQWNGNYSYMSNLEKWKRILE